ncbi:MAG TPA: response regulator [Chitinophagaceae bacterium]|nr:response regulator [Chitinophagaceae bacterium]
MEKLYQIVIVDDDELSGVINELLIRKYNCAEKIIVFDDPQNAIDYFKSLKEHATAETRFPELVLTDFNMPGMNGFELISQVKALDLPREVLFCILSASIDRIDDVTLEKNHVFKQLIKPLEKKEFMEVLNAVLAYAAA